MVLEKEMETNLRQAEPYPRAGVGSVLGNLVAEKLWKPL